MVAKRKSVEGGAASSNGVTRGLVGRLRKAGRNCAPEKIWSMLQAAMGGRRLNLRAALEAASVEASTPWRSRVSLDSKPKAISAKPKAISAKPKAIGAKLKAIGAKPKAIGAKPKAAVTKAAAKAVAKQGALPVRRTAVKREQDMVDLSQFEDLYDLINAWMRTKGVVKKEPLVPTKREAGTKTEPKVKREPMINRELVNEIRKLGIIDLTEGEPQPRAAGKRPSSGNASPSLKVRSPAVSAQASTSKGSNPSPPPSQSIRRSITKAKLVVQRRSQGKADGKVKAKIQKEEKAPRKKMPQGLKSLNKLASKCDPHKLWTILQAAAHENKPSASIGAALRAARNTASEAGHKPRQA